MAESLKMHPPIFFPPPPTVVVGSESNKPTPFKFNFRTRPETSDSTVSKSSISSYRKPCTETAHKSTLQQARSKVLAIRRTRQYILLTQLLLSFTILILSVVFAYCAALPHSDSFKTAAASSTYVSKLSPDSLSRIFRSRSTTTRRDLTQVDTIVAQGLSEDASNNALFTTRHALAALTFYSATLPLLTIAHTATELLSSLVRPETSQQTRIGDVLRSCQARRLTTILSFTVSALLALGWIIMQLFWINCEIAGFMGGEDGQGVCPVQIRGHHMVGISQLSIGKVVMGWIVVVIHVVYSAFMYFKVGVLKNQQRAASLGSGMASFRRKARFEQGATRQDGDADAETVFIGIDIEKPPPHAR